MAGLIFFWGVTCVRYDAVIPGIGGIDYSDQAPIGSVVLADAFGSALIVTERLPSVPATLMDRFGSGTVFSTRLPPPVCHHD